MGRKYGLLKYGAKTYDLDVVKPLEPWIPVAPILEPWVPVAAPTVPLWGGASTKKNTWVPAVNPTPRYQSHV